MRRKGDFAIGVACAIFAFMLTIQLKSAGSNSVRTTADAARSENLQALLYAEQDKSEQLYEKLMDYSDEVNRLRKAIGQPGGEAVELSERIASLEMISGVSDIEGPGIKISIEALPPQAGPDGAKANEISHLDIMEIVNDLWLSGAEAVDVNGSRLIVNSTFETKNGGVIIDGTPLSAPFLIGAVGDVQQMKKHLLGKQGTVETLAQWGIRLTVSEVEKLEIPAYKGRIAYEYAKAGQ